MIPTHERPELLVRAVASVLGQTHTDLECIVVDDASPAGPPELGDDPRLRTVVLPANVGQAAARNTGIRHATGSWVAFLDDDDEWLPDKLRRQLDRAAATGDRVVYSPYLIALGDRVAEHWIPLPEGDVFGELLRGWAPALTSSLLVDRELLGPGYDTALLGVEDFDLLLHLARQARFACEPTPLTIVDKTPTQGRHTFQLQVRLAAIERLRDKWAGSLGDEHLASSWQATCDELRLVAQLTLGRLADNDDVGRARLAVEALRSPLPRRTKWAGALRMLVGARVTNVVQSMFFRVRGRERPSSAAH